MSVQPMADSTIRVMMIVQQRFLEIAAQIDALPQSSQQRLVPYLWRKLQLLLFLTPGDMDRSVDPCALERYKAIHRFLDVFERMIGFEAQSVTLRTQFEEADFPEIANLCEVHRAMLYQRLK